MEIAVLGIDLGKNVCSLVGLDVEGRAVLRRRMHRRALLGFAQSQSSCTIAMEACCGAHHLGRQLAAQGHPVRLMSPEYVRPYVKAQKNDDRDAEAIAEAATRPTMRFVAIKTEAQLDMQILHRARDRLIGERTALINQLRAILLERGITVSQGRRKLESELPVILADGAGQLSSRIRQLISDLREEWQALDARIKAFDREFVARARADESTRRLTTVPGIGSINATALVAAVGDGKAFSCARDMAAWLGLVPRQRTTGGKAKLLGISKRGSRYLRKNLIHGARSILPSLTHHDSPLGRWVQGLSARAHKNKVIVALANKLARIAWAVLAHGCSFDAAFTAAAR
jgi:transposase